MNVPLISGQLAPMTTPQYNINIQDYSLSRSDAHRLLCLLEQLLLILLKVSATIAENEEQVEELKELEPAIIGCEIFTSQY